MTTVALAGMTLMGVTTRGGRASVQDVDGWLSRTIRRDRQTRPMQAGAFPSHGVDDVATHTIQGTIVYPDATAAALGRRDLIAIPLDGVELVVTDAAISGMRRVEVDSVAVKPVRDTMLTFTYVVTATDPLVYGTPVLAGLGGPGGVMSGTGRVWPRVWPRDWGVTGSASPSVAGLLPNDGTAAYHPVLRIDGPVSRPLVATSAGDTLLVDRSLLAGQWLDVDCAARRVMLNGQASLRGKTSATGDWLAVPPGGVTLSWTADGAGDGANLTATGYQGAWT